jgi:hypothetical protein
MNKISSYEELLQEKQRLKLLLSEREMAVRTEFEEIKTKLRPLTTIMDFAEKITTKDSTNPLINTGIDVGVNFLLRKVLLRNAGWILKLLTPIFVRNYISHEVKEHPAWLQKITGFIRKQFK